MARPKPNLTQEELKARQAKWVQNWRDKYPEKQALARRRAYINRKLKAFNVIGVAECKRCGCDELDFLEFNHIGGNGCKDWRKNKGTAMMDQILTKRRKTDDLEILCRVCNALDFLERKNREKSKNYKIIYSK